MKTEMTEPCSFPWQAQAEISDIEYAANLFIHPVRWRNLPFEDGWRADLDLKARICVE